MWHGWGVIQKVPKCFILLIVLFKVRKNTALLLCTTNQAGSGHNLRFQPKNPARAKLAEINNKNGCGTSEVRLRKFRSVSYHSYYYLRSWKINLSSVVPPTKSAHAISSIFSPNIQLGQNWQQSTTKMDVARLRYNVDSSYVFHIIDTDM